MAFPTLQLPIVPAATHKGEMGKVMVIGGSTDYYGAPVLTALGAEAAGADLIWVYLPKQHFHVAQHHSLNLFVKGFVRESLTSVDVDAIIADAQYVDVVAIGNGLGKTPEVRQALKVLLSKLNKPLVLDAESLWPEILEVKPKDADWLLTPHQGEFARVFGKAFSKGAISEMAALYNITILVKGPIDYIASPQITIENPTGCVEMRVGGTGDVLAGVVATYRAQRLPSMEAAYSAAHYYGRVGELLAAEEYSITAARLARYYPQGLRLLLK